MLICSLTLPAEVFILPSCHCICLNNLMGTVDFSFFDGLSWQQADKAILLSLCQAGILNS